ncbi:hypothetical protein pEaSNUABM34_00115 [Erwinia phage pEa_SNUABM_34]|nr:hypothetical protein pEaSNUABM34_00115 [Erwinia phage pEa_SNUABM_34]QYW03759.1 hypothetical protein pEaSNUABM45_00116 [Erwinia phage pEa_SNUABM_45]QYW04100.1 hypothetical protein pEaSNUABM46_00116 [Erwinia phage pEa_SNUABM_46]QYW05130.1 hypothetical protein pEaSNUABM21_00116 [Erwinia phage pEa_SNUABM_21]QYW05472.1 hypothetical protein pEaSNUABM25_00116 [Erwinia phage pEa_SNUABM_25]
MTDLKLSQIETTGNDEGKSVVAVAGGIQFESSDVLTTTQIASVKFDSKNGVLVLIKQNGDLVNIPGLPTSAMFGSGKQGKRGAPGAAGRDGRDGRDGSTGADGCGGLPGARGLNGTAGEPGRDGATGPDGDTGPDGKDGPTGPIGPTGPTGILGPRGNDGPSCIAGATGPTGPAPIETAVLSNVQPTASNVFVWLYPTANVSPAPPLPTISPLVASVSSLYMVGTRTVQGSDVFTSLAYLPVNARGGVGPYKYKWTITTTEGVNLDAIETNTCIVNFYLRLGLGADRTIRGTISCLVTDMGQPSRPTVTVKSALTVVARNPVSKTSGCIVFGSTVHTIAGSVPVERLSVGDMLASFSNQPKEFRKWSSPSLKGKNVYAAVRALKYGQEDHYFVINGQKFTHEHPVLIYDDKQWRYVPAREVKQGMQVRGRKGPVSVYECRRIDQLVNTVDIDVEPFDCYFVGDVLAHNTDMTAQAEKT